MLIIGGGPFQNPLGDTPDPWPNGLGIFDMSALTWTNGAYNASADAYEQSEMVREHYSQR